MRHIFLFTLLTLSTQEWALGVGIDSKNACYSAYHLQQQLKLEVKFGQNVERQNIKVDVNVHTREVALPKRKLLRGKGVNKAAKNVRAFAILVRPNVSSVNGVLMDMSQRYDHPFLVLTDADTGELLDLKSTNDDKAVLDEYLSFFDLFQYSNQPGKYQYRNGNGQYHAQVDVIKDKPEQLTRVNTGYVFDGHQKKPVIIDSSLSITLDNTKSECFYQKGKGIETFSTELSPNAYVNGDAMMTIKSDAKRDLPASHFFYTLTEDLTSWPSFKKPETITKEEAFSKMPFLMTKLSSLTSGDTKFLDNLLLDKAVWPYLSDYILEKGIPDETSLKLFWALDRIDSTASVNTLATLVTSPLDGRELFRAALALGSTSAPLSQESLKLLQNHVVNVANSETKSSEFLTLIRVLGAAADGRRVTAPLQNDEIKYFLYSQTNVHDDSVNAAVIDAIGNLGKSIDSEGKDILFDGLSKDSVDVRLSAASAFTRVPYDTVHSDKFIKKLANENNFQVKNEIIEVLGQTKKTDIVVKNQLLSSLKDSKLSSRSLESLRKIDYVYEPDEVHLLESKLSQETNNLNQKSLAILILKHRRKQQ